MLLGSLSLPLCLAECLLVVALQDRFVCLVYRLRSLYWSQWSSLSGSRVSLRDKETVGSVPAEAQDAADSGPVESGGDGRFSASWGTSGSVSVGCF